MTPPARTHTADAEALLVHAPFLRALARSLLGAGHPDEPDDLVQEAFLRAAERPPRDAEAGRGWLATVVKRLVAERGRREPRRSRWERAAARREAVPSTEEIVQREAVRRQVVDAVLALDEPYRSAILLRFYEDLPPREIAARLDVPVETARTRVKRGLALLQGRLDDAHDGDRRAWGLALAPLAWPARAQAASLAGLPLAPKTVALAAMVVVVAFTAWRVSTPSAPTSSPDAPSLASFDAPPEPAAPLVADDDARDAPRPLDVGATAGARLVFDVVDAGGAGLGGHVVSLVGCPVADAAEAVSLPRSAIVTSLETRVTRASVTGRATFAGVPQGIWVVATAPTASAPQQPVAKVIPHESTSTTGCQGLHAAVVTLDPGLPGAVVAAAVTRAAERIGLVDVDVTTASTSGTFERRLVLATSARDVTGRVVDLDGEALAGADVVVLPPELRAVADELGERAVLDAFADTLARTTSDAAGRFTLRAADGAALRASIDGHVARTVDASDAARITLRRRLGFSVRGVVETPDGEPVAGALVALSDVAPVFTDHAQFVDNVERFGKTHASTDARGRFAFEDVRHLAARDGRVTAVVSEDSPTLMVGASTDGSLPAYRSALVVDGAVDDVRVVLHPGGTLAGEVLLDTPGERVSIDAAGPDTTFGSTLASRGGSFSSYRARHGTWRFVVEVDGRESDEIVVDWRGQELELRPTFSRPTWIVDVDVVGSLDVGSPEELEAGLAPRVAIGPLRHAPGDRTPSVLHALREVDGRPRLVLGRDWDEVDEVWIAATCDGALLDVAHVRRGEPHARLDVTDARSRLGGLVVDVTDLCATSLLTPRVRLFATGARRASATLLHTRVVDVPTSSGPLAWLFGGTDDARRAEVRGRVAPGHYDVLVTPLSDGDSSALVRDVLVEAGRVTRLTPEPTPTTHVSFATPTTTGRAHRFALFDAEGRRRLQRAPSAMPLSAMLPSGTYTVHAATLDGHAGRVTFTVDERDAQRVTIPMRPAAPTTIRVATERARDDAAVLRVTVRDDSGRVLLDAERRAQAGFEPLELSLPAGAHTLTLDVDDVEVDRATLASDGAAPLEVTLTDA